ncbi:VCBS repeat-containing protein [Hyunsoonleella aestuarii]|uniref:VCBS repeat-containing protein n=1 Tax=Hyunsoonleella aestuarii TaxID=912802 RepID=A0ABP8E9C4_9FLAO|nr:VCBS repeat-containing protein [Hyunsoonleella aestuarii]
MSKFYISIVSFLILFSCGGKDEVIFRNTSPQNTGVDFTNALTETDDLNILDYLYFYNGGGVAVGDINNDGLSDIYLSGNQVKNRLFLNKGNLKFEDITEKANVFGNSTWNTGAVMGDVNGDGFLDIYVCAVVGINGFIGYNELFINNGDNTFTESAAKYGLDFDTFSSSAAFLDFDLDGDLDIYLLNHAIHTQESFGRSNLRYKRNYQTGDKLLRNDGNKFIDVSEEAGIYGGINGYGLGVSIADFNQDGFPDIFVGNDFHEDDYYYLNNGNGAFTESGRNYFGHTSRFSMGNDVADINHDGWPDLISLDMLAEDETVLKSSEGDDNIQIQKLRIQQYGYNYQFTRNMLFINQQDTPYLETALLSGISSTDWSWSALFADYNQDGEQDLFVSNGIPKRPNDLDFIKFASSDKIQVKISKTKLVDQEALDLMPSGKVHNYIFKGTESFSFEDKSGSWITDDKTVSGATALGDLDNDGDLDLVINNLNSPVSIYENTINEKANFLKIKLKYKKPNSLGIGAKIFLYSNGVMQYKELYTVRGFQASSEPVIHFGLGNQQIVDSLKIVWPNKTFQTSSNVEVNQTIEINLGNTSVFNYEVLKGNDKQLFNKVENNLGIDFTHKEDNYVDSNRQKLIPYQVSDRGPATSVGDLDNDGLDDIFFGSSKHMQSKVYLNSNEEFSEAEIDILKNESVKEDVVSLIADFNNDKRNDIVIGTGGADFYNKMKPLLDSYYVYKDSSFTSQALPNYFENASVTITNDFDKDGDLDIFVGSNVVSNDFGSIPSSYILNNDNGEFSLAENKSLEKAGMITDAIWDDYNNDGYTDLIVLGEWMAPKFFKNDKGKLKEEKVYNEELNGLWQSIEAFDIDNDGDKDYLLGNWGNNTKFKASNEAPMIMYFSDFDGNGSTETIVCTEKEGKYYPLLNFDDLSTQIVSLRKKFSSYKDFAGKPIELVFDKQALEKAIELEVHELRSGYLRNDGNGFSFVPFKEELQVSPITCFLNFDFDQDGKNEVLAAGNYFGVTPFHGRFDSFPGAIIKSKEEIVLGNKLGLQLSNYSARHLNIINNKGKKYLLVTINNDRVQVYELSN